MSSQSNASYNIGISERGNDVNWQGAAEPFRYRDFLKSKNYFIEKYRLQANAGNFQYGGSPIVFEIDKRGVTVGRTRLLWDRGPLLVNGAVVTDANGANVCQFVDYEGYFSIQEVVFMYDQQVFHNMPNNFCGDQLYMAAMTTDTPKQRQTEATIVNGQTTLAERQALASAARVSICTDLRVPWADSERRLVLAPLPKVIRLEVTLQPLKKCVYNPTNASTLSCDILNVPQLEIEVLQYKDADKQAKIDLTMTKTGIYSKITSHQVHLREVVPAQTGSGTVIRKLQLANFTESQYEMIAWLRRQCDVDDPTRLNPTHYVRPIRFWIEDNGTRITDITEMSPNNVLDDVARMHPTAKLNLPWMFWCWCPQELVEASDKDCNGSRPMGKYNKPTLCIELDIADLAVPLYLDVISKVHNVFLQVQGDVRRWLRI